MVNGRTTAGEAGQLAGWTDHVPEGPEAPAGSDEAYGDEASEDFFEVKARASTTGKQRKKHRRYQSMKAELGLGDGEGEQVPVLSMVDSGAVWCTISLDCLKCTLPKLMNKVETPI